MENDDKLPPGEEKYYWEYDFPLMGDMSLFFLVWRIFFYIFAAVSVFVFLTDMTGREDFFTSYWKTDLIAVGIMMSSMTLIVFAGYFIYAAINSFHSLMVFEMDSEGICHRQGAKESARAEKISRLILPSALKKGNFGLASASAAAGRTVMYTEFGKVKKISIVKKKNLIKLKCAIGANRIYVGGDGFDAVADYIIEACPGAKVTGKMGLTPSVREG